MAEETEDERIAREISQEEGRRVKHRFEDLKENEQRKVHTYETREDKAMDRGMAEAREHEARQSERIRQIESNQAHQRQDSDRNIARQMDPSEGYVRRNREIQYDKPREQPQYQNNPQQRLELQFANPMDRRAYPGGIKEWAATRPAVTKEVLGRIGHHASNVGKSILSLPGQVSDWHSKAKIKELKEKKFQRMASGTGQTYQEIKNEEKLNKLALRAREAEVKGIEARNGGGGVIAAIGKGLFGGGHTQGASYFNQYNRPQQGNNMLGGQPQQQSNPMDLGANMPGWFQQGIGRPQQQPQQGYGQRSYESSSQGGQQRPVRRYYKDEETHALAERNRELKNKQKQLKKIARRERAIANRESSLESYRARSQKPPADQGQGGGSISSMLFGGN